MFQKAGNHNQEVLPALRRQRPKKVEKESGRGRDVGE